MITIFSGYDSQALAMECLKRDFGAQFDYELVAWCEMVVRKINVNYENLH